MLAAVSESGRSQATRMDLLQVEAAGEAPVTADVKKVAATSMR